MGKNFRETLNEQLKDPPFKREYDELEPEFAIINAIIDNCKLRLQFIVLSFESRVFELFI